MKCKLSELHFNDMSNIFLDQHDKLTYLCHTQGPSSSSSSSGTNQNQTAPNRTPPHSSTSIPTDSTPLHTLYPVYGTKYFLAFHILSNVLGGNKNEISRLNRERVVLHTPAGKEPRCMCVCVCVRVCTRVLCYKYLSCTSHIFF